MIYYGSNMSFFLMGIAVALFAAGAGLAFGTAWLKWKIRKEEKRTDGL